MCLTVTGAELLDTFLAEPDRADTEIVFCTRGVYDDGHWYANIGYYCDDQNKKAYAGNGKPDTSALYRLNLKTKALTVLFDAQGGSVRDPHVDYDGRTVIFSYRPAGSDHYNLYQMLSDGTGLTRITSGPWDDYEPCRLPDGDIAFISTRSKRWVGCWYTQVGTIHRCKPDGSGIACISSNIEHDNTPAVLPDGRLIYMRWEYVDRSQVEYHHLWTMNPDGTGVNVFYGNMHSWIVMLGAQAIPGTQETLVCFSPGHGANDHAGHATIVTAANGPDCKESARRISNKWIRDPFPLNRDLFVMAHEKSLVLMNRAGKEEVLFAHPECNVHEPRLLTARPREPIIPSRVASGETTGQLVLQDVYTGRNMTGVKRGDIKKLLILETLPKPVNFSGGMDVTTFLGTFNLERVVGTVPVEEDGSASFTVPAERSLFFVALDANGMSVKRMQSFCNVMPGETFTCVGCHEERNSAANAQPAPDTLLALRRPPSAIEPFYGYPDVLDFQRDIQPILDRNCTACHNAAKRAGGVNLTAARTANHSAAYMTLLIHKQVADGRNGLGNQPPRTLGSSASPLLKRLSGGHKNVKATPEEWRTAWLWIESGAPYAGSYAAIRNTDQQHKSGHAAGAAYGPCHEIVNRRCASCHANTEDRNVNGIPFSHQVRMDKERTKIFPQPVGNYERLYLDDDPARKYDWAVLVNFTTPEESAILLAPLAKAAGGYGACGGNTVFADKDDPDYKKMLTSIQNAQKRYAENPPWGQEGWQPNPQYIREMKRFGVLPESFDIAKDPFDPFAIDQAYWRSAWPRPSGDKVSVIRK
ncbi:MAG: hypothetical protein FWG50_05915 [Kiritimatiellaeota bacterium]|nr:hypothetical protein [Kiritimatiellota bacterium]